MKTMNIQFRKNAIKIEGVKFTAVYIPVRIGNKSTLEAIKVQIISFISFKDDIKDFKVFSENGFDTFIINKSHKRFKEAGQQMIKSWGK